MATPRRTLITQKDKFQTTVYVNRGVPASLAIYSAGHLLAEDFYGRFNLSPCFNTGLWGGAEVRPVCGS